MLLLVCLWLYAARRFYTVWSTVLNFSAIGDRDNGQQPKGETTIARAGGRALSGHSLLHRAHSLPRSHKKPVPNGNFGINSSLPNDASQPSRARALLPFKSLFLVDQSLRRPQIAFTAPSERRWSCGFLSRLAGLESELSLKTPMQNC